MSDALPIESTTATASVTDAQTATSPQESAQATEQNVTDAQSTVQKTEGEKVEGEKVEGEKTEAKGAPEKYDFKPPEGLELDPVVMGKFEELARKRNLSQDDAQEFISELTPLIAKQNEETINVFAKRASDEWAAASKADKELTAGNFDENRAIAKTAFDVYGTPELAQLLNDSGLGNHPEVLRWALRVGKTLPSDSRHVQGQSQGAPGDARSFYPNSNHAA